MSEIVNEYSEMHEEKPRAEYEQLKKHNQRYDIQHAQRYRNCAENKYQKKDRRGDKHFEIIEDHIRDDKHRFRQVCSGHYIAVEPYGLNVIKHTSLKKAPYHGTGIYKHQIIGLISAQDINKYQIINSHTCQRLKHPPYPVEI